MKLTCVGKIMRVPYKSTPQLRFLEKLSIVKGWDKVIACYQIVAERQGCYNSDTFVTHTV